MTEPTDILAPLRALEPDAGTTVDIGRAIRTGKRRRRIRTGLTALAAVVLTAVALTPFLVRATEPPEPAGPPEFDLHHQVVRVGSAGGFSPMSYQTGRFQHTVALSRSTEVIAHDLGAVIVYARGHYPGQDGPDWTPPGQPAPDVHGRRALWPSDGGRLVWEWADGAWAKVRLADTFPDTSDRAHRVAQSVAVLTEGVPVRVPVTVDGSALGEVKLVGVRTPLRRTNNLGGVVLAPSHDPDAPNAVVVLGDDFRVRVDEISTPLMGVAGGAIDSVEAVTDPSNQDAWVTDPIR